MKVWQLICLVLCLGGAPFIALSVIAFTENDPSALGMLVITLAVPYPIALAMWKRCSDPTYPVDDFLKREVIFK